MTASFGVCSAIGAEIELEPMFEAADRSLYEAKRAGRNRVAFRTGAGDEPTVLEADGLRSGAAAPDYSPTAALPVALVP